MPILAHYLNFIAKLVLYVILALLIACCQNPTDLRQHLAGTDQLIITNLTHSKISYTLASRHWIEFFVYELGTQNLFSPLKSTDKPTYSLRFIKQKDRQPLALMQLYEGKQICRVQVGSKVFFRQTTEKQALMLKLLKRYPFVSPLLD